MKNKIIAANMLFIFSILGTGFISCKKEIIRQQPSGDNIENKSRVQNRGKGNNNYSDTFRLVSFTGTKTQGSNGYDSYFQIDFSVVGEKNVTSYEIESSPNGTDYWYASLKYTKIIVSNPTNYLISHSQIGGFGNVGSGKKINFTDYFRLKITLVNGNIQYSNLIKVLYSQLWNPWA